MRISDWSSDVCSSDLGFGRAQEMPFLAIGGEVDRIARAFERVLELLAQAGLILDDQNAHVQSPCYAADGGCSAIGPADDAARPPVDVHPDQDSIAQELERVNGARRIEHEAEITRILQHRPEPPFHVAPA